MVTLYWLMEITSHILYLIRDWFFSKILPSFLYMEPKKKEIVKKFIKDDSIKVAWLSLIDFGQPTTDPSWYLKKTRLNEGYKAERIVKDKNDDIYRVIVSIERSFLGVPLFIAGAFKGVKTLEGSVIFNTVQHFTPQLSSTRITTLTHEIKLQLSHMRFLVNLKFKQKKLAR